MYCTRVVQDRTSDWLLETR